MYASGYDNKYIEFQFSERGIEDVVIDKIVEDINELRKGNKQHEGMKLIILSD